MKSVRKGNRHDVERNGLAVLSDLLIRLLYHCSTCILLSLPETELLRSATANIGRQARSINAKVSRQKIYA